MFFYSIIQDVDECKQGTDRCAHTCTNTNGSFLCSCNNGYTLAGDGKSCEGIMIKYMADLYVYIMHLNGFFIFMQRIDIDECALKYDNCHTNALCTNTDGSYTCACNEGYTGNGTNCTGNRLHESKL